MGGASFHSLLLKVDLPTFLPSEASIRLFFKMASSGLFQQVQTARRIKRSSEYIASEQHSWGIQG